MQAIAITRTVYAATREENAVGAIILIRQDARLSRCQWTSLPADEARDEATHPRRGGQDGKTQLYVVGAVDPSVAQEVERDLGYAVRELRAADPLELADLLDRWQAAHRAPASR